VSFTSTLVALDCQLYFLIFEVDLGSRYQNVSTLDFYGAKRDSGGGGNNWSCKMYKAPAKMSPPTNHHPVFFTDRMPFLSPNQQCQSTNQFNSLCT